MKSPTEIACSLIVSFALFLFSQLSLALVPKLLPWLSLIAMLPVSALVLVGIIGLGKVVKRMTGVHLSAPAMVIFHLLFLWGVYIAVIRQAISSLLDAIISAECVLLLFGLYRILIGDPGIVADEYPSSSMLHNFYDIPEPNLYVENSSSFSRIRYCKICKNSVQGFDHHCPAFGNCIGQKNQRLFMMLLIGFIITEASYTISSTQYITKSLRLYEVGFETSSCRPTRLPAQAPAPTRLPAPAPTGSDISNSTSTQTWMDPTQTSTDPLPAPSFLNDLPGNLVISTLLFTVLQLIWQAVFLMWNVYCICTNIKTDEWANWKKYPEFQLVIQPQSGNPELRFSNPYNKGILGNIKDFLNPMGCNFEPNSGRC